MTQEQSNEGDAKKLAVDDSTSDISKSQRKREAEEITQLGRALSELSQSELDKIPLEDNIREGVDTLRKIDSFGAKKRQMLYLGKLMRSVDLAPVHAAMNAIRLSANTETQHFKHLEQWRDKLLADQDDALSEFIGLYPSADRQRIRQLIRNSQREKSQNKPPKSARELFKLLRECLDNTS